ncbi:MAG: hypothetical protein DRO73_11710 [Candidatus Thorarchaeota archaeon]|nr:MAG: hypothetical protein DRO73_11710 [Candidatus Thorarchaeota archaeon]
MMAEMVSTLTYHILGVGVGLAIASGFFWGDKYSTRYYNRILKLMFGGNIRSLCTGEIPIVLAFLLSVLLFDIGNIEKMLTAIIGCEVAYFVIGLSLFTNWRVGPFSFAPRHGIRVYWIVNAFEKRGTIVENFLSANVESMFWAARNGNSKSAHLLSSLSQRDDELGRRVRVLIQYLEEQAGQ